MTISSPGQTEKQICFEKEDQISKKYAFKPMLGDRQEFENKHKTVRSNHKYSNANSSEKYKSIEQSIVNIFLLPKPVCS